MRNLKTIISTLVLLTAISCAKVRTGDDVAGQVSFNVNGKFEIADLTKSSVSDYTTLPSTEDFNLSITSGTASFSWEGKVSEWDPATPVPGGNYTVTATCGSIEEEGFDKPYFVGTSDFTVTPEETTEVSVNAALGNTVVLIRCSDAFANYFSDYTFRVVRGGQQIAEFVKGETRGAFVDGYRFSIEGTIAGPTKEYTFNKDYTSLAEATAYTFNFDVSNVGGSSITISFNDTVETVELGDLELNE